MKLLLITLFISVIFYLSGDSFYSLSYTGLGGTVISLSELQGKKVVVFPFNGAHPDLSMLQYMDSILRLHQDSLAVLAVPGLEFDSTANSGVLSHLRDSLGLQLSFAEPSFVQKGSGPGQIPLFQWLTTMNRNRHFNRDVEEAGQLFVISKRGMLYSVINSAVYRSVINRIIRANVTEQTDSVGMLWVK